MRTNLSVLLESPAFQLYRQERQGSGQGLACADKTGILPLQAPTYFHLPSLTHFLNARPPNLGPSPRTTSSPMSCFYAEMTGTSRPKADHTQQGLHHRF